MHFSRRLSGKVDKTLIVLVALNLITKLALLNWNQAEYTDSVFYLTIGQIGKSKWLPVYPFLVHFTHLFVPDLTLSGRLTSIIINTLSIFPLYAIAKRIYNKRAAAYAAALFIVAPVITRWSIRVMTESTFTLFLLLSLWYLIKWFDSARGLYGMGFMLFSGIAALTRPEGIGLLPMILAFAVYMIYRQRVRAVGWIVAGLLPWFLQLLWHMKVVGRYGYGQELQKGVEGVTFARYFSYLIRYIVFLPYIVVPVVFIFAVYGIYKSVRYGSGERKAYHLFAAYLLAVWLLSLPFHWAWTTRFMFPLVAILIMFSGYGLSCIKGFRPRVAAFAICVIISIASTALVLMCSRATFGDIRGAAYFVRDNLASDAKIVSCETTKTVFWSERKVGKYERENLKPGMYVMLQNIYCDYEWEMNYLKEKYDIEIVYQKAGTVVPVLSDEMYLRPKTRKDGTIALQGGGNYPISLGMQFGKHRFESTVVLIKGQKLAQTQIPKSLTIQYGFAYSTDGFSAAIRRRNL